MTTLMSVYNSSGCVGRCDAKCYDATDEHCDCICRGANHGIGKKAATQNIREFMDKKVKEATGKGLNFKFSDEIKQPNLF